MAKDLASRQSACSLLPDSWLQLLAALLFMFVTAAPALSAEQNACDGAYYLEEVKEFEQLAPEQQEQVMEQIRAVQRHVSRHLVYPARAAGQRCVVLVQQRGDGCIIAAQPSPNECNAPDLREAAVAALQEANPLPLGDVQDLFPQRFYLEFAPNSGAGRASRKDK